ncbi:MAG: DUF2971 domain-containing protein, partial [Fimbriimonadaceae bacterium]|nr:DUF2971 domain-containing protein [Fimbriimonadaceae bacterium]
MKDEVDRLFGVAEERLFRPYVPILAAGEVLRTQPLPEVLWHVTSAEACRKILESRQMLLSDLSTMNDPLEIKLGAKKLLARLRSQMALDCPDFKPFLSVLNDVVRSVSRGCQGLYCHSLTSEIENCRLWRQYGDDGKGCAIGFRGNDLFQRWDTRLVRVLYSKEDHDTLLRHFVEEYLGLVTVYREWSDQREQWSHRMGSFMSRALSSLKRTSFAWEQEWRLVLEPVASSGVPQGQRPCYPVPLEDFGGVSELKV